MVNNVSGKIDGQLNRWDKLVHVCACVSAHGGEYVCKNDSYILFFPVVCLLIIPYPLSSQF